MKLPGLIPSLGKAIYLAACITAPFIFDSGDLRLMTEILLMLTMAQMWNLLAGYTGLVSMGHQVFVGSGAYFLFFVSEQLGISPYWVLPFCAFWSALVAAVVAPFLFRLRDAYFSIGTWVFADIVYLLVSKAGWLGGTRGIPLRSIRLVDRDWFAPISFWLAAAIAWVAVLGLLALMRSRFGLGLMSVRDNDLAATSVGVDVWRNRFVAFVLSASVCGLAGAIYYMTTVFIEPLSGFDVNWVVVMMFIVIIGGIGTIEGPLIGTAIYFGLREFFSNMLELSDSWYLVAMGTAAVVTMLIAPRGIWGLVQEKLGIEGFNIRRKPPALPPISF